jgi:hypothetical protein
MKKTKPVELLSFDNDYSSYHEFAEDTRTDIYKSIYEIFNKLKESKDNELKLVISAKIEGLEWNTDLNFTKNDKIVIKRDLLPYFEKNEDYEMCMNLKNLYEELS